MVDIQLYRPGELTPEVWQDVHALQHTALTEMLVHGPAGRTQEQVDILTMWDDHDRFVASHTDPNSEVGGRFHANNLYRLPRIVIAREYGDLIGFAYSANNTSGGGSPDGPHNPSLKARAIREAKQFVPPKNYLWLREIAVDPHHQRQGTARQMARKLLLRQLPLQQVAAYMRPTEAPFLQPFLERVGLHVTGEEDVEIYGAYGPCVRQVRMAGWAASMLVRMRKAA